MIEPIHHIRALLGEGGRCLFLPNGGNLGDCLIAAATIQCFERHRVPWAFIRGQRASITPRDVLVMGGGGSLVSLYQGGIDCLASLVGRGAPVVVLPQSVNGHPDFWRSISGMTVFCRDRPSLAYLEGFPGVQAYPAHDMALGLDLSREPYSTVAAIGAGFRQSGQARALRAFRRDDEGVGLADGAGLDLSALAFPDMMSSEPAVVGQACAFLAAIACHSEIHTDRLHVAIAGCLLGIPTVLHDNSYGKNRAVYEWSLHERFSGLVTLAGEDRREPA